MLTVWGYAPESRKTYRDGLTNRFWTTTLSFPSSDDSACRHALDSFNKMKRMNVSGWICFDDGGNELWGEDKR